jgi:hypothetical protein
MRCWHTTSFLINCKYAIAFFLFMGLLQEKKSIFLAKGTMLKMVIYDKI